MRKIVYSASGSGTLSRPLRAVPVKMQAVAAKMQYRGNSLPQNPENPFFLSAIVYHLLPIVYRLFVYQPRKTLCLI